MESLKLQHGSGATMGTNVRIPRKHLNSEDFLRFRQATEKIAHTLSKRLKGHLEILKPLFIPRILLGNFVKSANMEEVPGAEKAFAELQEVYAKICEKPFSLPRKLEPPLSPISHQLEMTPFQYTLSPEVSQGKPIDITSPVQWILSYRGECSLNRLKAMALGLETHQPEEMRQTLVNHLTMVIFLRHSSGLSQLFQDLRYQVEVKELTDMENLSVVVLKAPVQTFLPPDDFILQVTQLSGIAAFQELIDPEAIEKMDDPLREMLRKLTP